MSEDQVPPVHALPRDILIEIFSLVQSGPIFFGNPAAIQIEQISLVCRSWREVAFNTPQLWAHVSLSPQRIPGDRSHFHDMRKSWRLLLERSGNCSLNLSLSFTFDQVLPLLPLFLESCFEHTYRWERVEFCFPLNALTLSASILDTTYPRLRSVNLEHPVCVSRLKDVPTFDLFKNAPLLRALSLHGLPYPIQGLRLPWSQLTHCDIHLSWHGEKINKVATISELMPNLVSLGVFNNTARPDDGLSVMNTEFPSLRKLAFQTIASPIRPFLDSIRAPGLKELEILGVDANWSSSVERFLLRSGCHVTSLTFAANVPLKASFLARLPHLEFLTILSLNYDTVDGLTLNGSQQVCPCIRRLVLTSNYLSKPLWETVTSMVESRLCLSKDPDLTRHNCKLESLHFIWETSHVTDGSSHRGRDFITALGLLKERLSDRCFIPITYEKRLSDFN